MSELETDERRVSSFLIAQIREKAEICFPCHLDSLTTHRTVSFSNIYENNFYTFRVK